LGRGTGKKRHIRGGDLSWKKVFREREKNENKNIAQMPPLQSRGYHEKSAEESEKNVFSSGWGGDRVGKVEEILREKPELKDERRRRGASP